MEQFVEIIPPRDTLGPKYTDVFVLTPVIPQKCKQLLEQLAREIPAKDLSFLKRVRTTKSNNDSKKSIMSVLLGHVDEVRQRYVLNEIGKHFDMGSVDAKAVVVSVPARPPASKIEAEEFKSIWPTRTVGRKPELSPLMDAAYVERLKQGLEWAIQLGGAVVVDDATNTVIASSQNEKTEQNIPSQCPNPLVTPILLALQGVSRIERKQILQQESGPQRYLLTGLDVYTVAEPTIFEAMALLHARVRRVVFGRSRSDGLTSHSIHALRNTNHRYRAFACVANTDLWKRCENSSGDDQCSSMEGY